MRVVVITGSRDWKATRPIQLALVGANLVIHGGARGADALAEAAAAYLQIDTLVMRARWSSKGGSAGPERNERMAQKARELMDAGHDVECFAFPAPYSVGTWDCVRRMKAHGVLTTVYGAEQQREVR